MAGANWFGNESEIIPNLYVGDLQDAARFRGMIISVLPERFRGRTAACDSDPVPRQWPRDARYDRRANRCRSRAQLPVLVHCEEGCERAPLTVAWFLTRRRGMTLDQAYDLLQSRRPIIRDRRRWLGIYANS